MTRPTIFPAIRIGYLAGREIPINEIAAQAGCDPGLIRNALNLAKVKLPAERGPVIIVSLPADHFLPHLDEVGRARRMSRDEIARSILFNILRGGKDAIEQALDRSAV